MTEHDHDCESELEMRAEMERDGGAPAMLWVGGKRFSCERCGANVFTRIPPGNFSCNGCAAMYLDPGWTRTEEVPF